MTGSCDQEDPNAVEAALKAMLLAIEEKVGSLETRSDGESPSEQPGRVQWIDAAYPATIPLHTLLTQRRQSAALHPDDAERQADLGETLWKLDILSDAAAAFEKVELLDPATFRYFGRLARCYVFLDRPNDALQVCERWNEVLPKSADLHFVRGLALRKLGRREEARDAFLRATALSPSAFEAVECLMIPVASLPDGSKLLALCDELPVIYANSTVVRGYRAIGLSRVGRADEARAIMDLENYVAQVEFEPPPGFGGIDDFNALLAEEILANPDLRHMPNYGFRRTERLNMAGARAFPVLAKFFRVAMEQYVEQFPERRLDAIMPAAPKRAYLNTAGNVVHGSERHRSHLHKFAYISGVYHVSVPPNVERNEGRAGTLVVGSCDHLTEEYAPCWGTRDIKPTPGVATIFPSHMFHSVVSTCSTGLRIAIPFDLCAAENDDDPALPN